MTNTQNSDKYLKNLSKKYTTARHLNESLLKNKMKPWQRVVSISFTIFCVFIISFMGLFCINLLNAKTQNTPTTLLGYSTLKIVSGSMEASGFDIGEPVVVHAVDTDTLKEGDVIAFYSCNSSPYEIQAIDNQNATIKYIYPLGSFFGIQSQEIKNVAKTNTKLVFHQIIGVYQDTNGERYFKTKGTSNDVEDVWLISHNHVLGVYVDSGFANFISKLLSIGNSPVVFFIMLIIPILLLCFMLIRTSQHNIQVVKLGLDCIEEKRKITDPICVKHEVGFHMDKKSKLKILATAPDDQKAEYANLLWKEDKMPRFVRLYCLKRTAVLTPLQQLRDINRNCEKMYKDGTSIVAISKYYAQERAKIDDKITLRYKRLMKLS